MLHRVWLLPSKGILLHDDNYHDKYDENAMTMTIMVTMMKGALGDCHPKVILS